MPKKLTENQLNALHRLDTVPHDMVLQARGRLRMGCNALVKMGYAEFLGNDIWTGSFFKITKAGRLEAMK